MVRKGLFPNPSESVTWIGGTLLMKKLHCLPHLQLLMPLHIQVDLLLCHAIYGAGLCGKSYAYHEMRFYSWREKPSPLQIKDFVNLSLPCCCH